MRYLLDTNICIYCISRKLPHVLSAVERNKPVGIAVSAITKAEMFAGSYRPHSPIWYRQEQDAFLQQFPCLPFDDAAADIYGRFYAFLESKGQRMGIPDLQIAAIAMANELTVVTHDIRGFTRLSDLLIEDWATE